MIENTFSVGIILLLLLFLFLSLLVTVVTKGHTYFNKPTPLAASLFKYVSPFVTTVIEEVIIINLFSDAATSNQKSNI